MSRFEAFTDDELRVLRLAQHHFLGNGAVLAQTQKALDREIAAEQHYRNRLDISDIDRRMSLNTLTHSG